MLFRLLLTQVSVLLLLLASLPTHASTNHVFKWRDHSGKKFQLAVKLPSDSLQRAQHDHDQLKFFISNTQGAVNQYSYRALVQYFSRYQEPGQHTPPVQIRLSPDGLSARSRHKHLLKMFESKAKQVQEQAYQHYFHVACDKLGVPSEIQPCILLDYPGLIERYSQDLQPLANEFRQLFRQHRISDPRSKLSIMASFVQTLPYAVGESWFRNPLMVLSDRQGDCDERVLLTRILLDLVEPSINSQLVILPLKNGTQHMLLMVDLPPRRDDRKMKIGDTTFIPLELTSLVPIGQVAGDEVKQSLKQLKAWAIWEPAS